MKRALLLFAFAACVPATESQKPAGAGGFHTEPTPASKGQAFVTDDGWTVTVDALVLRGWVSASPVDTNGRYGGGSDNYLWNARDVVDLYAPALSIGKWSVHMQLQGAYVGDQFSEDEPVDLGVDPRIALRFKERVQFEHNPYGGYDQGPFGVLVAHGSKDGRVTKLDITLAEGYGSGGNQEAFNVVDVTENALSSTALPIDAAKMFFDKGKLVFQPVADADADQDGDVTEAELDKVRVPCASCVQNGGELGSDGSLLIVLSQRARALL